MAWHRPRFGLPRLYCLPRRRKLLTFDFSTTIDRAIEDEATKIRAADDEVSVEQIVSAKWLLRAESLLESPMSSKLLNE
ncbi:pentatricopeptide repeat-containing protein [Pyrus ussuriensis x Pyrus communis]|uniref:Pentatricopeptide repeat-containing protein n=1 Tax=Pyrus ussuriensis x Pyrus communis TaxID=2448454 RepID=A0A5N5I5I8_9ROSA|nr:pentatricopeptide repeat-containing protein [Pyrus ussuriensis x Pyrus communis]